jgi:hypothetical protein
VFDNKVQSGELKKRHESFSTKIWSMSLVTLVLLVIGEVEFNPGPPVEQALSYKSEENGQDHKTDVKRLINMKCPI